jgi:hypothetical protein
MNFTIQEAVKVLSQKFLLQEGIVGVSHHSQQLTVYVESTEDAAKVPPTLMGFPVKIVVSGPIYALNTLPPGKVGHTLGGLAGTKTDKWRPCPGGVSVGHPMVTAGTLSTRVYDLATNARLFLSNNHVIAASNRGKVGDPIIQPGPYDGGTSADILGTLERFIELKAPPETNLVDAAVGKPLKDADLSDEVLDIGVVTRVEEASVGMTVEKSGRTTCHASATITDVNATVKVSGYPGVDYYVFEDQIITTYLAAPGDSGSLCVNAATKAAVGLLFAGSQTNTVLNKMTNVAKLLNITFRPPPPPPPVRPMGIPMLGMLPLILGAVWFGSASEKAIT